MPSVRNPETMYPAVRFPCFDFSCNLESFPARKSRRMPNESLYRCAVDPNDGCKSAEYDLCPTLTSR